MQPRAEYIWYNGDFVKWEAAKIHVLSYGLHYGTGAFEGIRVYNQRPFKAKEHYARLRKSAAVCGINIEYTDDQLVDFTQQLINKNQLQNGYIRPVAWLNSDELLIGSKNTYPEIAIALWESFYGKNEIKSLKLMISDYHKPHANSFPNAHKTTASYMMQRIVKMQALEQGYNDALMLDQKGNVTEATTSNFFIIKNKELITPAPSDFLLGITRRTVMNIAKAQGATVLERDISLDDLIKMQPEAAFLTGTAIEMQPISHINMHDGKGLEMDTVNHPLFNQLLQQFTQEAAA